MLARTVLFFASLGLALSVMGGDAALAARPDKSSSCSRRNSGWITATDATASPYVNLKCYQSGNLVAEGWAGFFDGALGDRTFGLYSPQWTGGAADCTAWLDMYSHGKWKELASTSFHVSL